MLPVIILALPFPFWDKRTVGGEGVFIKISDMGNQITLAVPDVKPSLVIKFLPADNCMDFKVGLFIPADALTLIQSFIMLFFIQNAKQPVPKCKAKLRKSVVQLPVIKGGMLGESDRKRDAVGLFLGRCCLLYTSDAADE